MITDRTSPNVYLVSFGILLFFVCIVVALDAIYNAQYRDGDSSITITPSQPFIYTYYGQHANYSASSSYRYWAYHASYVYFDFEYKVIGKSLCVQASVYSGPYLSSLDFRDQFLTRARTLVIHRVNESNSTSSSTANFTDANSTTAVPSTATANETLAPTLESYLSAGNLNNVTSIRRLISEFNEANSKRYCLRSVASDKEAFPNDRLASFDAFANSDFGRAVTNMVRDLQILQIRLDDTIMRMHSSNQPYMPPLPKSTTNNTASSSSFLLPQEDDVLSLEAAEKIISEVEQGNSTRCALPFRQQQFLQAAPPFTVELENPALHCTGLELWHYRFDILLDIQRYRLAWLCQTSATKFSENLFDVRLYSFVRPSTLVIEAVFMCATLFAMLRMTTELKFEGHLNLDGTGGVWRLRFTSEDKAAQFRNVFWVAFMLMSITVVVVATLQISSSVALANFATGTAADSRKITEDALCLAPQKQPKQQHEEQQPPTARQQALDIVLTQDIGTEHPVLPRNLGRSTWNGVGYLDLPNVASGVGIGGVALALWIVAVCTREDGGGGNHHSNSNNSGNNNSSSTQQQNQRPRFRQIHNRNVGRGHPQNSFYEWQREDQEMDELMLTLHAPGTSAAQASQAANQRVVAGRRPIAVNLHGGECPVCMDEAADVGELVHVGTTAPSGSLTEHAMCSLCRLRHSTSASYNKCPFCRQDIALE